MNSPHPDPRIRQIYELLQGLVQTPSKPSDSSHWDVPVLPPPDPEGRLSSTDLLSWWFHSPRQNPGGWDGFFSPPETSDEPLPALDSLRPVQEPAGQGVAGDSSREATIESPPLLAIWPEPEEHLADENAQAAVDVLYDWLHAVGRRDIDAAMACISEDYHAIEDDREVDRLRLRQYLESHLDALHDWHLEVSLAEAPEPLSHPYGILIAAEIQLDAFHPETGDKTCQVEPRIALLRQDHRGDWKMAALSLVER